MSYGQSYSDNQPLRYIGRVPVYATTILTVGFVVGLIFCALLDAADNYGFLSALAFVSPDFLHGKLWQPLTYVWLGAVNFFTPLGIMCFFSWGLEVEKYIGRWRFLTLFGLLVATPVVLGLAFHAIGIPAVAAGSYQLVAALLIAFATLYPGIEYLGWIPLKWFAFACITIGSLMYFPKHQWIELSYLWGCCAVAFGYIRWVQHGGEFAMPKISLPSFRRRPRLRVLPDPVVADNKELEPEEDEATSEVDALLDKIAKSGINSLTAKERKRLEKAREDLMKRESPRQ